MRLSPRSAGGKAAGLIGASAAAWFLAAISLPLLFLLGLRIADRIPNGHDSFQYLTLQWVFLNSAATTGTIPQWMPYMTQGTVATWWYAIQAAPLQAAILPLGAWLKSISFLSWFYLGVGFDFVLLSLGVWLLSARFMKSPAARFFATITASLSAIWYSQPWYTLHFYFALPLVLYFLHRFLDERRARYVFLAGSLFLLQLFGNLPYFSPVASFVVALYGAIYVIANRKESLPALSGTLRNKGFLVALAGLIAMAVGAYVLLSAGTRQIVFPEEFGRTLGGTVSFSDFITYAAKLGLKRWAELGLGVAPDLDCSLFVGYLALPLIALSALGANRRSAPFFGVALALAALAQGNRLAAFLFFHLWPLAGFYRHLALVANILRLFLCFLAGFGVESLASRSPMPASSKRVLLASCVTLLCVAGYLAWLQANPQRMIHFVSGYWGSEGGLPPLVWKDFPLNVVLPANFLTRADLLEQCLWRSNFFALAAGALCFGLARARSRRWSPLLVLCLLQLTDIGSYHWMELRERTHALTPAALAAFDYQAMPYATRRISDIVATPNPRFGAFMSEFPFLGSSYWSSYMFYMVDSVNSEFRTDTWLEPLDHLLSALHFSRPPDMSMAPGRKPVHLPFAFPASKAAAKIAGLSEDKVQFFSGAYEAADWKEIAGIVGNPKFDADALLIQGEGRDAAPLSSLRPRVDDRAAVPYRVLRFDADHLTIEADNSKGRARWLFYSDVWHPDWKARMNGAPVPVYRADLAYKAVPIQTGIETIELEFGSPWIRGLRLGLAALAWFWIVLTGALLVRTVSP